MSQFDSQCVTGQIDICCARASDHMVISGVCRFGAAKIVAGLSILPTC